MLMSSFFFIITVFHFTAECNMHFLFKALAAVNKLTIHGEKRDHLLMAQ